MILNKIVIANNAPSMPGAIWGKPVKGGFILYANYDGGWKPITFDTSLIDFESLSKEASNSIKKSIVGKKSDNEGRLTLYGLKTYIDTALQQQKSLIEALGKDSTATVPMSDDTEEFEEEE